MLNNQISDGNPNGTIIGLGPTDRVSLYNAVPIAQRSSPMQQLIQGGPMGQVLTLRATATPSPATVAANSAAEATVAVTGLLASDFIFSVNKNNGTFNAGLGIAGVRLAGAGSLGVNFTNNTGATVTPTVGDSYTVVALRGMNPLSLALSPASVAANTTVEQVFDLTPTTKAVLGTPVVNGAGQITAIPVTSGGSGYQVPPTVVISSGTPGATTLTGTFSGVGIDPAPLASSGITQIQATGSGGYGASAMAILTAGVVTGIQMTHVGKNYSATYLPTATLLDGTYVALGQTVQVNKAAQQAGLGIINARVVMNNQIGITFCNYTVATIITPTASETYQVLALNEIPAVSPWSELGLTVTSTSATGTSATVTEVSVTASGVLATDMPAVPIKPTHTAGLAIVGGRAAANAVVMSLVNPTTVAITPSGSEVYVVPILRAAPVAPSQLYVQLITPASVVADTTAEQTFTVTGLVMTNSIPSTVIVRKPTKTAGLDIVGFRVTAANTLGITYQNLTDTAIVPPAEYYQIMNFQDVPPAVDGWIADWASFGFNQMVDGYNEASQSLMTIGLNRGA